MRCCVYTDKDFGLNKYLRIKEMVLTTERAEIISKYLAVKGEEASALFELVVNEAVAKINAAGYDFYC